MTCYNCGYSVSVVSRDDNGWLCEWCSDHELKNPLWELIEKKIKELDWTSDKDHWEEGLRQGLLKLLEESKQ